MLGGLGAVAVKTAGLAVRDVEMSRLQKTERAKGPGSGQGGQNGTELIHSEAPRQDPNTVITGKTRSLSTAGSRGHGAEAKELAFVLSTEGSW